MNKLGIKQNGRMAEFVRKNSVLATTTLILILVVLVVGLFAGSYYFTAANLINVALQATPVVIIAIGMGGILIIGGIDLSSGAIMVLSSLLMGELVVNHGVPAWLGLLIALAIGATCGLINGLLITKVGMVPFLTTLEQLRCSAVWDRNLLKAKR